MILIRFKFDLNRKIIKQTFNGQQNKASRYQKNAQLLFSHTNKYNIGYLDFQQDHLYSYLLTDFYEVRIKYDTIYFFKLFLLSVWTWSKARWNKS